MSLIDCSDNAPNKGIPPPAVKLAAAAQLLFLLLVAAHVLYPTAVTATSPTYRYLAHS